MKINNKLKLAIARYYFNRENQYEERRIDGTSMTLRVAKSDAPRWDKDADLKAIGELAAKSGYRFSAASGTFWFKKNNRVIQVNESNWLDGGVSEKSQRKAA